MRQLAKKNTPSKEDLYFAVKLAQQKLSKYCVEGTPTMGVLLISAHILDPFRKLRLFREWDKGKHIHPKDETSYTTQYQEAFFEYVENEYCVWHGREPVIEPESVPSNNVFPSPTASVSGQSSFDPYDLSSYDEEYLLPNNVAETKPRRSNCPAGLLTAATLSLNWPPESPKHWWRDIPNPNDYHSNRMEVSSTIWIPDITDRWRTGGTTLKVSRSL